MEGSRARAARSRRPASCTATGTVSCETKEPTTSSLGNLVTESHSTEWTDEKHSLYLKSMETSFVNQLYESMDLLGFCRLSDPTFSRKKHFSTLTPSGQFKVHRNGSWQRINFERAADLQVKKEDESDGFLANPWIQHFRPGCTPDVVAFADVRKNAASTSQATCYLKQTPASHSHPCHHNFVGSDTEVSDQNFVDDEVEGEKESQMCNAKKTESLVIDASSNDQVVPLNECSAAEDATKNCISAARETMSPVTGRQKTRLTT
ncbi:cold-regulated protein 27 isoform X2 [Corylus avellana]|uniref:cold-regulated protein 27 isoform X2 n=1 Tax=Corylus avellana TaxID=13451 RepID=UPI00286A3F86|nr:cold-regulated protein 27 isoform X2 [Corylus avellana]